MGTRHFKYFSDYVVIHNLEVIWKAQLNFNLEMTKMVRLNCTINNFRVSTAAGTLLQNIEWTGLFK